MRLKTLKLREILYWWLDYDEKSALRTKLVVPLLRSYILGHVDKLRFLWFVELSRALYSCYIVNTYSLPVSTS